MRIYLVTISDIPSFESDEKFKDFIVENKYEWWRYMPLVWALATPDSVTTNSLIAKITECYGAIFSFVLEIDVKDVGGVYPASKEMVENMPKGWTPFEWFAKVRDPNYVPSWNR
ncbi:hypothetical protein [Sphingobacterium faecium]|uniref:hypothetical protein n=1 Tax=Sphingobacterium faecium TaxID=34087 RepID=UPI00247A4BD7|nr:hypothetical protein [Sphingobacterium faecium]WGQ15562.1 hypothetical protein QG727_03940 [Sphingobacterium faecium]